MMDRTLLSLIAALVLIAGIPQGHASEQKSAKGATKSAVIVNVNTANATELETLPGIGAATAARIVEYRQKNGPFKKLEELMNVQGIGEKSFLKLRPQITIAAKPDGGRSQQ
jgi:competence protein ComEA